MLSMSIQLMQEEIVGKVGSLLKSLGVGRTEEEEFMKVNGVKQGFSTFSNWRPTRLNKTKFGDP
jgi:hypothetical protein